MTVIGLFESAVISKLRLGIGLKESSMHLCDKISINVLKNLIPCGVGMSPFAGTIETMSLKFFFIENAVNHSSVKEEDKNYSQKAHNDVKAFNHH